MTHEKIFRGIDGSRLKVRVHLYTNSIDNDFRWEHSVYKCEPKKRTWRQLTPRDIRATPIAKDEILETLGELWTKIKPPQLTS